jgi:hypothetical protein
VWECCKIKKSVNGLTTPDQSKAYQTGKFLL